jgi:hypothetical protein
LCLTRGSESDAMEFCVEVCLRKCASLAELCEEIAGRAALIEVTAFVCVRETNGFVVLGVRSGRSAGRLWSVSAGGRVAEHLEDQQKRRAGSALVRQRVFISVDSMTEPPLLFVGSSELSVSDFAATLGEAYAEKEKDVFAHILAASNDGFGGGCTMLCCNLREKEERLLNPSVPTFVASLSFNRASAAVTSFQSCSSEFRAAAGFNVPLAVSISETAAQIVIMCQTLSSSTLSVTSDGRSVVITMTFPDEGAVDIAGGGAIVIGEAEFFGPIVREVALPVNKFLFFFS